MPLKRQRTDLEQDPSDNNRKRVCLSAPEDLLSELSDELLIRILHNLPIQTLLQCQRLSHKFYFLAGDSQIWKSLYYTRFVLPRALRLPGVRSSQLDDFLDFSSRRSKWLDDNTLVNRLDGKRTNWKRQYKLRHNWSIGACEVQEMHVADRPSVPSMLVKLAEGLVITADKEEGLRAWSLKDKELIAFCKLRDGMTPTCLAIDEQENETLRIAVGFEDGGWGMWKLNENNDGFESLYRHPASSSGALSAIALARPYLLSITDSQLLSLYTFAPILEDLEQPLQDHDNVTKGLGPPEHVDSPRDLKFHPRLLASLKSHTSWPPVSLSIRTTSSTIIASIAYSLPTYLSGFTIGLQELHLSLATGSVTFSRLTSALPQGFSSSLSPLTSIPSLGTSSPISSQPPAAGARLALSSRPTSLSYSHPYLLATHPDNTLTLYLCNSTASSLAITPGTKLWGHTSSVSSAEITPRGKAVSVSTRGNELRVWELEGGLSTSSSWSPTSSSKRMTKLLERSVQIKTNEKEDDADELDRYRDQVDDRKRWVGFDDEMVIVLKESCAGSQALMIYDFT